MYEVVGLNVGYLQLSVKREGGFFAEYVHNSRLYPFELFIISLKMKITKKARVTEKLNDSASMGKI